MSNTITQKQLQEILHYDKDTGIFTWIKRNKVAGTVQQTGYITIGINRKVYYSHRLAWLYVNGMFPKNHIDHINHTRNDNSLCNLRVVSRIENQRNTKKNKNNKSGVMGVYKWSNGNKWAASIKISSKTIYLGSYENKEDAIKARKEAEIKYNFHPNHGLL